MTIDDTPTIPLEAVSSYPLPGMAIPGAIAFSPDDELITYLLSPDRSLARQLYAFDPASGEQQVLLAPADGGATEANISLEEKLRRERARQREVGVTEYAWAKKADRLLVPLRGDIWVQDGPRAPLRRLLASDGAPALTPVLSPDGAWVAYVRDAELYVLPIDGPSTHSTSSGQASSGATGAPRRITAAPGKHAVVLDHACRRFVDIHDALDAPP